MTNRIIHPAYAMEFSALEEGLRKACEAGHVYSRYDSVTGRTLYCYTKSCVYEGAWNEFSTLARGLILNLSERRIIAAPFPKFFNLLEGRTAVPDLPFRVYEKMDGSLAIIHHDGMRWRAATKGSLESSQALWTERLLAAGNTSALVPGTTYLAEVVYPENRIVVRYDYAGAVLLGAYGPGGLETEDAELGAVADACGWRVPRSFSFSGMDELLHRASELSADEEGYVLRFTDGTRVKVKGGEYCRVHATISRCTPLAIWENMVAGDSGEAMRRLLPEEFLTDYDGISTLLESRVSAVMSDILKAAHEVSELSDKELGLCKSMPSEMKSYVFLLRKSRSVPDIKLRAAILRRIRPSGNILDGYMPSYAMQRMDDE